jgi:hypothetical protein
MLHVSTAALSVAAGPWRALIAASIIERGDWLAPAAAAAASSAGCGVGGTGWLLRTSMMLLLLLMVLVVPVTHSVLRLHCFSCRVTSHARRYLLQGQQVAAR